MGYSLFFLFILFTSIHLLVGSITPPPPTKQPLVRKVFFLIYTKLNDSKRESLLASLYRYLRFGLSMRAERVLQGKYSKARRLIFDSGRDKRKECIK